MIIKDLIDLYKLKKVERTLKKIREAKEFIPHNPKNGQTIFYEGQFRIVEEIDSSHIHLQDGTVIRNSEIIKLPFGIWVSKYSEEKKIESINRMVDSINRRFEEWIKDKKIN
jgi:hypothetical protein